MTMMVKIIKFLFLILLVALSWKHATTEEEDECSINVGLTASTRTTNPANALDDSSFENGCTSDDNCPAYGYCNSTSRKCQCRFGVEEWQLSTDYFPKTCVTPPSCTFDIDCNVNEKCKGWKCECVNGYRRESNICHPANWCETNANCHNNLTICVKKTCQCKQGFPKFDDYGILMSCDTNNLKGCSSDENCTITEQCSDGHCRCKFGIVQGASGKHYCKTINFCDDDDYCPFAAGYCYQEEKLCVCESGVPVAYSNGKIYKCATNQFTFAFAVILLVLWVGVLTLLERTQNSS